MTFESITPFRYKVAEQRVTFVFIVVYRNMVTWPAWTAVRAKDPTPRNMQQITVPLPHLSLKGKGVLDMSWATDKQGVLPASPGSLAWSKILTAAGNHWKDLSRGTSDQICISKGLSDCRWRTKWRAAEEAREYSGPGGGRGCANTLVILHLPCLPLRIVLRAFSLLTAACVLPCRVLLRSLSQTCPSVFP